jgi:hypothetical protein
MDQLRMRRIKKYKELFEAQTGLTREQIKWLNKCTYGKWTLDKKTGLVNVNGDFDCSGQGLTDFKGVRFGNVEGNFFCSRNSLTSLEGAPKKAWSFDCKNNLLTSLEGGPQEIGGFYYCHNNKLTSLEGFPRKLGIFPDFDIFDNPVSERTLKIIGNKMLKGMSFPQALVDSWRNMKSEDKILMAPHNPNLSTEELKSYQALDKFRNKII